MWWLDDSRFNGKDDHLMRLYRRRSSAMAGSGRRPQKRMSLLSEAEVEANLRLLECGSSPQANAGVEDQLLERWRQSVTDRTRDRETFQIRQQHLRKLLLEAERKLADREQELADVHLEIEQQVSRSTQQLDDLRKCHESEALLLQATTVSAERRAEKAQSRADQADQELAKMRAYVDRLTGSHQAQLQEIRRQCELDVEAVNERLASCQSECEQLRSRLSEQVNELQESESKRTRMAKDLALTTQQYQIAEHIIRQMQQEHAVSRSPRAA